MFDKLINGLLLVEPNVKFKKKNNNKLLIFFGNYEFSLSTRSGNSISITKKKRYGILGDWYFKGCNEKFFHDALALTIKRCYPSHLFVTLNKQFEYNKI
ncbi:hypothetical protein [Fibrella aquatica]|jgi:hypothetical protein|uniref:hypothetical protein n=1 Tax=Fibrella aquatica TaxID=3242487 RepID=UPI003520307D